MIKFSLIRIPLFSFLLLLIAPSLLYATTERRTALVIGNGNYNFGRLKNPVNDANDMTVALRKLGFNVVVKKDVVKREMLDAINAFGNSLKSGGVGLFFYAGHAVQMNGINYLIPIGSQVNDESDVEHEAIDLSRVLGKMNVAKNTMNIVILDACRDNPFRSISRSVSRGLAIIPKAPSGTIISYSTSPGDIAMDGTDRNSPYTSALLQYLDEPGLTIEQVFKNTRLQLETKTRGKQVPWEVSSLRGDFYFKPGNRDYAPSNYTGPAVENSDPETEMWKVVKGSSNPADIEDFLSSYPNGKFTNAARIKLKQLQNDPSVVKMDDENVQPKMKKMKVIKTPGRWETSTSSLGTAVKTWIPPEYETQMVPDR